MIHQEHPILFSAPMIRAILAGQKTQTRRVVKLYGYGYDGFDSVYETRDGDIVDVVTLCPYGRKGDKLWVKETFAKIYNQDGCLDHERTCPCEGCHIEYRADTDTKRPGGWPDDSEDAERAKWTPSIFMPRYASRIILEITDIKVQRLQDIDNGDAYAEGVPDLRTMENGWDLRDCYKHLWNKINSKNPQYTWDKNPPVWVITFKRK